MKSKDDRIRYLTTKEASNMTGYEVSYVRRLLIAGKLEGKRAGWRDWMVDYDSAKALRLKGHYAYQQAIKAKNLLEG